MPSASTLSPRPTRSGSGRDAGLRFSFRWWESLTQRPCACNHQLDVLRYEPPWQTLRDDGCWDSSCPGCGRVVTVYDLRWRHRQPPRGPAPTQPQREAGWTDDDALDLWGEKY